MEKNGLRTRSTYCIRVKETLKRDFGSWFDDLRITPQENGGTLLVGEFADQSALRGFMDQLWNLNFTIDYVIRMTKEQKVDNLRSGNNFD